MFSEYDVVIAIADLNKQVKKGAKGAVMLVLDAEAQVYEVEFIDDSGDSIGVMSVRGECLQLAEAA